MSLPGMFNPMLMAQGGSGTPAITGTATTLTTSASTNHVINLPSGIVAGEILFVSSPVAFTTGVWTVPSGWTAITDPSFSTQAAIYKVASGSEGSTVTIVSDNTGTSGVAYRISGVSTSTAPEHAGAISSGTNPDPPSLSPSWGASSQTIFFATSIMIGGGITVSSYPANYTLNQLNPSGAVAVQIGCAARILQVSSEDPGTFTISTSATWGAQTIGFRGA